MKQHKGAGIFRDKKRRAALMTALAFFLLGTIFLVSTYTYYTPVAREDTVAVNATFSSYREITGKNSRREIKVFFDDRELLVMESACMTNAEVYEKMRKLKAGDRLEMRIHPKRGYILEVVCDGEELLSFEKAERLIAGQRRSDAIFAAVLYLLAIVSVISAAVTGRHRH
ncbi:MAG TPA: hypothetical protein DD628_03775 [Clostridiales bacterium]|nr:hypothetical protein [Candidatus Apopatosoma intestinale]